MPDPTLPASTADPAGRTRRTILRRVGIAAVLVVWLALAGIGGPAIGKLSTVQDNDSENFLPTGAESVRANELSQKFVTERSLPAFVVFSGPEAATPEQLNSWQAFGTEVLTAPVTRDETRLGVVEDFLASPRIAVIPAEDGRAALAIVPLDQEAVTVRDADGRSSLGPVIGAVREAADSWAAGAQANVTGPAALISDLVAAFAGIDGILLIVALGAVLLILLLVYRAVALPFAVLLNSVFGLALAGWVVYLLADADLILLNGQSQGILFILVVGAATDYGLLLVARYREELTRTASSWTAMTRAWRGCVEPILASAGTVIIGVLCLLMSDLRSNQSLGPVGAIGIAGAVVAALTLLPAMLLTGRWIFWPRIPRLAGSGSPSSGTTGISDRSGTVTPRSGDQDQARPVSGAGADGGPGLWGRIAGVVGRNPRRVWAITAVVLAAFCLAIPTFKAAGTAQTEVFLTEVDSVAGQQALQQHFPAGAGDPILVIAPESAVDAVKAVVPTVPGLAEDPVLTADPASRQPLVVDGMVQVQLTGTATEAAEAARTITDLRAALHALPQGDQILVGGNAAVQADTVATSQHDLWVIIPSILAAVFIVLVLLLRALVAPLLLMLATVLSFGTAMGVAALMFNHVFGFPGADPAVPLFAFVFLVALGIDYSIFLMTRAREEVAVHGHAAGVTRALTVTGGVITSAGVVLAATFAALSVIPLLFLAQVAFIVAFGVLLDTLVVRTLLVPALVIDVGRVAWWPIRPKPRTYSSGHPVELDHE